MHPRPLFDNHNFVKIMMMFWKSLLRLAGSITTGALQEGKKSLLCNRFILPPGALARRDYRATSVIDSKRSVR
ncbi:Uncharacterised protein [Serratia fonticola]|uniref:Uncharacterized protein n=1 Tax=Serratia fonticola TaxID=47917 RepID=A0A4U9THW0_SERFO|nr:Uncharacterised protein [Serratia fonticola]